VLETIQEESSTSKVSFPNPSFLLSFFLSIHKEKKTKFAFGLKLELELQIKFSLSLFEMETKI
jgi:hypothetical protein